MGSAFLDRQRDQTECDGEHRHANHARKNIHRGLAGKAKALLLGIGLQIIACGQGVGKGRGIEADRSPQAVIASNTAKIRTAAASCFRFVLFMVISSISAFRRYFFGWRMEGPLPTAEFGV